MFKHLIRTARSGLSLALALVTTAAALATVNAAAQAPAIIPVEQEPRHRTVHEDAQVRVLEIRIPAGDESLMHNHLHDGVHITVQGAHRTAPTMTRVPRIPSP